MVNFYKDQINRQVQRDRGGLPLISTALDSVRTYQFEVTFEGVPNSSVQQSLTLAAKQVAAVGFGVETIKVFRVNDLVHYPGKVAHEAVKITFDNLYAVKSQEALWEWFKTVYNPMTGDQTSGNSRLGSPGSRQFKAKRLRIVELDNTRTPIGAIDLYGVYPEKVEFAERNYASQGDFNTMVVDFQYDYIDYYRK
jgi:hypothetical protein